jgi:hypothetical protein
LNNQTYRPQSESAHAFQYHSAVDCALFRHKEGEKVSWVRTNILGLRTRDRTLLILAKMTSNTYTTPNASDLDALGWLE